MAVKDKLKTDLFPTIWCPGCGIGLIMQQLATSWTISAWTRTTPS
jgi:pyruvate/2-oxoacid:ferredoxin oxidoreductase beta subunit